MDVSDLNAPGIRFRVPDQNGAPMMGLAAVGYQFDIQLTWYDNFDEYGTRLSACMVCRFCIRPRCRLCNKCNTKKLKVCSLISVVKLNCILGN